MKKYLLPAVKLTALSLLLIMGIYTFILLGISQLMPGKGMGKMIADNGKTYYANIGQDFRGDQYFWSRPSAVEYNADGSGGSNLGPNNPELLLVIQSRIDSFMLHNPGIHKSDIPVEMVTASASGLDPHISVKAALVQAKRIAAHRKISEERVVQLIHTYSEKPLLGLMGPTKINVLKLNLALDNIE